MAGLPVVSTNPRFAWQSGVFSFQRGASRSRQTVCGNKACGKTLYIAWQQGFSMACRWLILNIVDLLENCNFYGFVEISINKILKNTKKRKNTVRK
ncbi:hypothetical protein [Comamonas thiooxydans]|uniref:hypothetical protein n=1 Tax=Comamonas thiooxydans TaxID=363952 RepID=UPI001CCD289F|nr:hypothetical protein [Comamonas thiooxydans]UBQ41250.1 hypothetical protein LCH15_21425 [Comamonas thiooxydans]